MALVVYWGMAFVLPKGILKEVEKRLCSFLWKGTLSSGYPKVAWDLVCRPTDEGGLRLRNVHILNQVLMSKHLWDVIRGDRSSIWVECIYITRLRDRTVWMVSETTGSWGWKKLLKLRSLLLPHIRFLVGDGMTFSLWRDPWHELGPVIHLFSRGPNLTRTDVAAPLASVIINGQWVWPVQGYRRNFMEFLQILHSLPTIHGGVDRVEWKHNGGTFFTSSVYDHFRTLGLKVGWSSLLSGVFKIPRNSFILWLAILGKLSTLDKP
ncbi:UNVERIFIED_CONTAM: hypothetical protein Sradi_7036000 [Sesamum radiatum]|uniref:Reverse transcriptase zinc-binding domain-containing protein n=1 Tax=Sesamum radiatum TaxID=300843 RepID=A0AAW2JB71_SESRA